jgi:DNA polymerase
MNKPAFCNNCTLNNRPLVKGQIGLRKDIIFIGEAPGYDEVKFDRPFVGKSGKLFNSILNDLNIDRNELYISNSCLCHPINKDGSNRKPTVNEIKCCNNRLLNSIATICPEVIVSLGAVALYALVEPESLDKIIMKNYVGKYYTSKNGFKVFSTYHPAAALRNSNYKDIIKNHIKEVLEEL